MESRVMKHEWVRPVVATVLCLAAAALLWYGAGALFEHDPTANTGALDAAWLEPAPLSFED
jgi:hypothetical protein